MTIEDFLNLELPTIEAFLKLKESAVKYDFSNDGANENYRKLNDMEKFFSYMEENANDPDSKSQLLQKIYRELWDVKKYFNIEKEKVKVSGETLNSVNTTLIELYKFKEDDEEFKIRKSYGKYQRISINFILSEYKRDSKIIKNILDIEELKKFVNSYHTIGNFMPIPKGCNRPGKTNVRDYWDLTLLHIYNYYNGDKKNKDNEIGYIMKESKIKAYKDWLDRFGEGQDGWYNFVKQNYLEPFVDTESYNYFPKELWNGHFKGKVLPKKDQIIEYFINAQTCIWERGILMVKELSNRINNSK